MPVFRRVIAPLAVLTALALGASAGTYVVRPGDTLSGIAAQLGVSVRSLAQANAITDVNRVFAGQALAIPGSVAATPAPAPAGTSRAHVVAPGETLTAIAARYGTTVRAVVLANNLRDPNHVRIGATLRIPNVPAPAGLPAGLPARLLASPARLALIPHFERWATANGLAPDLVMAVAWQESGWQNNVVSGAGAIGIGQLLPSTAAFVAQDLIGVNLDPTIPADNIRMTARYLRWLLVRSGGDVSLALAGYYQGPASVASLGLFPSTRDYIAIVGALRPMFRAR